MQLNINFPEDNHPPIRFISLASGSSGNCYFLGYNDYGILIDAGISPKNIRKHLKEVNIAMESVQAVLITHDHADHIKSVTYLSEKLHIPIYTTALTHEGINKNYCIKEKLYNNVHHIQKEQPFIIKDFSITAFEVPHDGTDNVGYTIKVNHKTFSFVTDLGEITPLVASYICNTNYLILEANYDEEMLKMGPYPAYLKRRIASNTGHLSNLATANFLADNLTESVEYIWLCHLSKDNNHPELAYKTVEWKLRNKGILVGKDLQLIALKRNSPSQLYEF
ncbi:MBL fold metallo-hydrolase [Bacteroides sp. 519]|uniref:MBL fold metallo-hydrolase n=1 Tax=Bacteroides sp. 519 TaxID=2302937 RepID=UPI0013D0F009|nr:MBL fold metallo-hydrolase [Bacteroides sp. 519]NDV58856.1 MBL fold metallo-hydrolase [Bacteroides sp. 519]